MPNKFKIITVALIFVLSSCKKEQFFTDFQLQSISELTINLEPEIKERTQLRLAFGKAVSRALSNVDFRNYILSKSKVNGQPYFNEILFALHKDDVVCGMTLKEIINDAADQEIIDLLGDNFVEKVLINDPLVSIKIPDIFNKFEWNTSNNSPMVYVSTPISFSKDEIYSYKAYHSSGHHQMVDINKPPEYFCIVVKYSEDYFLWDINNQLNENDLSIFHIIPQFQECWTDIQEALQDSGSESLLENLKYYFIKDLKQIHDDHCLNDDGYQYILDDMSCQEECKRDCRPLSKTNTYLDSISFQQRLMYTEIAKGANLIYTDNITLKFLLWNEDVRRTLFFGLKYAEVFNIDPQYNFEFKKEKIANIGKVKLPKVDISINNEDIWRSIHLKLLLNNNFKYTHPNTQLRIESFFVSYTSIIKNTPVSIYGQGNYDMYSSYYVQNANARWYYCDTNEIWKSFGAFAANVKY